MSVWKRLLVGAVVVMAALMIFVPGTSTAGGVVAHDYVGAERCKSCHAEAFAIWEQSPHRRAYEVLDAEARKNPRCLACHTMVADDLQPALRGVQCESCHGAGRHYTPEYVMRDAELSSLLGLVTKVDARSCEQCHTESVPALHPFNFDTKKMMIKHWADPKPSSKP